MPKITEYIFNINQERVKIGIYYGTSKKFYAKNVPDDILALQEGQPEGFEKESELYHYLHHAIDHYHEEIKKSRKVIVYSLSMTTNLCMNKIDQNHWSGFKEWLPDDFSHRSKMEGEGYGFSISWSVLMEISSAELNYYEINDDGSIGYGTYLDNRSVIEWTPEREAAFEEIAASLEKMVKKIAGVLCDKERFNFILDNKIKLLEN